MNNDSAYIRKVVSHVKHTEEMNCVKTVLGTGSGSH
uniref:Uncharacterized protein n=1 Tax=Anguilla anguilla TaxID=7936 RepID=A0A0E9RZR7_ANGAN